MNNTVSRFIIHNIIPPNTQSFTKFHLHVTSPTRHRSFRTLAFSQPPSVSDEKMVVVGGGAAGIYGAIRAKTLAPNLNVIVIEKGKPLAKVKISGGGRCNVTNGHCADNMILAEQYPRGSKEFRGSFFNVHGPSDTMSWFTDHGVELKTEEDGRVFPVSDNSSSIVDCLLNEARQRGVKLQTGKSVTSASTSAGGKFMLKVEKRTIDYVEFIEADYLLIASGSSQQGYNLVSQLGHSIIKPVPSLFTFKIDDKPLTELSGVGPMLVTHWGLSGPVVLRLSAWGARDLFSSDYKGKESVCLYDRTFKLLVMRISLHIDSGTLLVDFSPDVHCEDLKSLLSQHKKQFPMGKGSVRQVGYQKQKVGGSYPPEFGIVKRFWKYLLNCEGQFKDEFVTAGGVPLSEISLKTMESRIKSRLFFAGE
ncbi:hypothetical protein M8C21_028490, partial [Ambrosia artemisiifolia]